jgi:DNA-binding Xre family transcriptional regulator
MANYVSRTLGERRLSIYTAARRAGLSVHSVADLYYGLAKRVGLATLGRLCGAISVGVGDLLEYVRSTRSDR